MRRIALGGLLGLLAVLLTLLASCGSASAGTVTIRNDVPKVDVAGHTIDAHEGQIVYDGATRRYWLIGNGYGCGYQWTHAAAPWCGFRAYTSPDLVHWTDHGPLFDPSGSFWQQLCAYPKLGCFDIRLLHDTSVPGGMWRAWFNVYGAESGYYAMSAQQLGGPWHLNAEPHLAVGGGHPGRGNGAMSLFRDRDGAAYIAYTAWTLGGYYVIEQLDGHFLTGTGRHVVAVTETNAEDPVLFRDPSGAYQIVYDSPGCAWCAGIPTKYATAPGSIWGGWMRRGTISPLGCGGAFTFVSQLPGGVFLYMTDMWTNKAPGVRLVPPWNGMTDIEYSQQWNQAGADQRWELLRFASGSVISAIRCPATEAVTVP